jgi:hypothetical protein
MPPRRMSTSLPYYRQPGASASTPDSDETGHSRSGSFDLSRAPRVTQSAPKTTGSSASRGHLIDPRESPSSPHLSPLPMSPGSIVRCGICPVPLHTPYPAENPIHHFFTPCQHPFHHVCYLTYITTAAPNERTRCPTCHENGKPRVPQTSFVVINI